MTTVDVFVLTRCQAFTCSFHPLGKLLDSLIDVYRATYVGVGAHPRLLRQAVLEMKSFVKRVYVIVRYATSSSCTSLLVRHRQIQYMLL